MGKKITQKYLDLIREILEDSGLINPKIIKNFRVTENPFSDEIDIKLEFFPTAEIGQSEYENLVDNIWNVVYTMLRQPTSVRSNWHEFIQRKKMGTVMENHELWIKRRKDTFDEMFVETLKDFLSKRNFKEYTQRVTLEEFIETIVFRVLDDIFEKNIQSQNSNLPWDELQDFLMTNYKEKLTQLWLNYR